MPALALAPLLAALAAAPPPSAPGPILIGLDLEFGHASSVSATAVQQGVDLAVDELNAAGGLLGGRKLEVVPLDNRAVPARGVENLRNLAARPDLVAVFCGKFSPVVLEQLPVLHELELPLLDPWAAADGITQHGLKPSYTFRLSLSDTVAVRALLAHAGKRGFKKLAVLLPNTGWGRSAAAAIEAAKGQPGVPAVAITRWYNMGAEGFKVENDAFRAAGADALLFVGNEGPGSVLVKEVATLPEAQRLPIVAHHGVAGGDLVAMSGPALHQVDLTVVQFFSFVGNDRPRARALFQSLRKQGGVTDERQVVSAQGLAAAYDLTHLLVRAIRQAGSTDRKAIRQALESLPALEGAVRTQQPVFTPARHEAIGPGEAFMARYDASGALVPIRK